MGGYCHSVPRPGMAQEVTQLRAWAGGPNRQLQALMLYVRVVFDFTLTALIVTWQNPIVSYVSDAGVHEHSAMAF